VRWYNRLKPAYVVADTAGCTLRRVNHGDFSARKVVFLLLRGIEHQLQVGRVHVGVGQNERQFARGQVCQRRRDGCLAGAAFAAEDDELLYIH